MNRRITALLCATILAYAPLQTIIASETQRAAPDCILTSLSGEQQHDLKKFRGKVLYVDFWASWCTPCAQSFPFMNALDHDLRDKGLQVVGINLDENTDDAKDFLAKLPASFTLAADSTQQCARDFGVQAMPSSYLIDRNGVIRYEHLGFRPGEAEQFRQLVEQLLAEKPTGQ